MLKVKNILVPTDFSEHSDKALKLALDIAIQNKAKLYLLHVIHEAMHQCAADYCLSDDMMRQMESGMTSAAKQNLQKQLAKFREASKADVVTVVRSGFPSDEILKEQQKKKIDLIVIAPLGRSGIERFLVGSVTTNIVKEAKCPVLVAK
jgi:universal stress protein A